jgi:hypothetical protein
MYAVSADRSVSLELTLFSFIDTVPAVGSNFPVAAYGDLLQLSVDIDTNNGKQAAP